MKHRDDTEFPTQISEINASVPYFEEIITRHHHQLLVGKNTIALESSNVEALFILMLPTNEIQLTKYCNCTVIILKKVHERKQKLECSFPCSCKTVLSRLQKVI